MKQTQNNFCAVFKSYCITRFLKILKLTMLLFLISAFQVLAGTVEQGLSETGNQNVLAQVQEITGTVTDEDGSSLPGVNIVVEGTTEGTITDLDGNYSIEVPPGSRLVFSYVGYQEQIVEIESGVTTVNIKLEVGMIELERVVKI